MNTQIKQDKYYELWQINISLRPKNKQPNMFLFVKIKVHGNVNNIPQIWSLLYL